MFSFERVSVCSHLPFHLPSHPAPGKNRAAQPDSSKPSTVTEQVHQPENLSQPVSPRATEPQPQSRSTVKLGGKRSTPPGEKAPAPADFGSPQDTGRAAIPRNIGAAPASTIPHVSVVSQERSQGARGNHSKASETTGVHLPKISKEDILLEDTAAASSRTASASPSLPVATDRTQNSCGSVAEHCCLLENRESPVTDTDSPIREAEGSETRAQSSQTADYRAHQRGSQSQLPAGAGGGMTHNAQPVMGDQVPSPRKPWAPQPPQWSSQPSVLDSISPDKHLTVSKNFLSNYSRNFSSFHEDSNSLSGLGDSTEPSLSSMYGDAEDSSSDPESLAEAPQASARGNWSPAHSHGSSQKEDTTESEEEQIEICSTNGCPDTPPMTAHDPAQAELCPAFAKVLPLQHSALSEAVGDPCERAYVLPGAEHACIPTSSQTFSFLDVSSKKHETLMDVNVSQSHRPLCTETMAASSASSATERSQPSEGTGRCHNLPVTFSNLNMINGLGRDLLDEEIPNKEAVDASTVHSVYALGAEGPKNGEAVLANLYISKSHGLDDLLQKPKMISRKPIMAWFKEINKNSQGIYLQNKSEKENASMLARSPDSKTQTVSTSHKKGVAVPNSPPPLKQTHENKDLSKKSSVETLLSNCQKPKCGPKLKRLSIKNKSKAGSEAPVPSSTKAGGTDHRKSLISPQTSNRMLSKAVSHQLHEADQEKSNIPMNTPVSPQCVLENKPPLATSGSLRASASDTSIRMFTSPLTSPKTLPEQGTSSRFHTAVYSESDTSFPTTPRSPRCGLEGKVPHADSGSVSPTVSRNSVALAGIRQSELLTPSQVDSGSEAAQPRGIVEKRSKGIASNPLERTTQLKIVEISSERMPKNACGDKPADSDRQGGFLAQSNCQEEREVRFQQSVESALNQPASTSHAFQVQHEMQPPLSMARLASSSSPQLPNKRPDSSQGRTSQMPASLGVPKNGTPMGPGVEEHPYFTPRPATRTYSMPAQFSSHFGREGSSPQSPSRSPQDSQVPVLSGGLSEAKAAKGLANGQGVYSVKPLLETSRNLPPTNEGVPETSCLVSDKVKVTRRQYYYEQSWPHESTSFFSVKQRIKSFENLANSDRSTTKSTASPFLSVSSKPPISRRSSGSITSGSLSHPTDAAARSLRRSLSSCSESQSEAGALLPQITKSPSSMTLIVSQQNPPETSNKGSSSDPKKSLVPLGIPTPTVTLASPIKRNKSSVRHTQPSPVSRSKLQELRALSMPDLDKLCGGEDYSAGPGAVLFRTQLEIVPRRSLGSPPRGLDGASSLLHPTNGGTRACLGGKTPPASEPAAPSVAMEGGEPVRPLTSGKNWSVE